MVPPQRPGDFNQVSRRRKVFRPHLLKCIQAGPLFLTSICHLNVGRGLWSWAPPCARPHRQGVTSVPSAFTAVHTRKHPRILQCLWCGHPAHVAPRGPCLYLLFRSQHAQQCFSFCILGQIRLVLLRVERERVGGSNFVWYCLEWREKGSMGWRPRTVSRVQISAQVVNRRQCVACKRFCASRGLH